MTPAPNSHSALVAMTGPALLDPLRPLLNAMALASTVVAMP